MNNALYRLAVLPVALFLYGCDSGGINDVKSSVNYRVDSTMTIGTAFDTRTDCINGFWSEEKDNKKRTLVSYECTVSDAGVSVINDFLLRYPSGWLKASISHHRLTIDSSKEDEKNFDLIIKSLTQQAPLIQKYMNELRTAFEQDSLISSKLNFNQYLNRMISLTNSRDSGAVASACDSYGLVDRWSGVSKEYARESCLKHIYPVFEKYEKNVRRLSVPALYDYYQHLTSLTGEYDNEDTTTRVSEYMKETMDDYRARKADIPLTIRKNHEAIDRLNNAYKSTKERLNVSDVRLHYYWIVSEVDGVSQVGGDISFYKNNKSYRINISESGFDNFIRYAYQTYSSNEIPGYYPRAIFSEVRYDIDKEHENLT